MYLNLCKLLGVTKLQFLYASNGDENIAYLLGWERVEKYSIGKTIRPAFEISYALRKRWP